ncbi:MAG: lipopolysaccharide transport periplasmic protein LptA [Pseudomonadales bacterium]
MKHLASLTVLGLALVCNSVVALPNDRSKPIEIQADSAERDAKTGITTYTGNVDVQQGSIHIVASKVVLNSANDKLTKIHAIGSPATYHQQLTGPNDVVDAQALNIYFDVAKNVITLQDSASLKQNSGSIKGDRIEYDTKAERVKAQSSRAGGNDNSRRVTVIIPPSTSDEASSNSKTKNKSE